MDVPNCSQPSRRESASDLFDASERHRTGSAAPRRRVSQGRGLHWTFAVLGASEAAAQTVVPGAGDRPIVDEGAGTGESAAPILVFAFGLAAVVLAFWIWKQRWYRYFLRDRLAINIVVALVVSVISITVLTHHFEHQADNEHFRTRTESLWSITVYLFSGLEDRSPITVEGRILAAVGLLISPIFFAFATGWLARTLINAEKPMPRHLTDHYLFLNWSPRTVELVRELHHPVIREREGTSVIVVLTDDESLSIRRLKEVGRGEGESFEDLYLSVGDPTNERALLNANAQDARAVLITADERSGLHADERTIRSVIMLRRIALAKRRTDLHVVAELVDPANEEVLAEIAKDFPGLLQPIASLQVRTGLMAQAILNEGVVDFYADLLRVTGDTNEVYARPIPASAAGMRFRDYCRCLLQDDGAEEPLLAVGVQRRVEGGLKIFCNPRSGSPGAVLKRGDKLVVIAYEPPSVGALPAHGVDAGMAVS